MIEVEAVKNVDDVKMVSGLLRKHYSEQMSDVWVLGLQLALRITDLLSIRFDDIQGDRLVIKEGKTGKVANIALNQTAKSVISRIKKANPDAVYLFQATARNVKGVKPITRQAVGQAFKAVGEIVGVKLSTHSMRKTRGYLMYKQTNDLARVMKMLRHSSQAETLRYIGIEQEDIDSDFMMEVLA